MGVGKRNPTTYALGIRPNRNSVCSLALHAQNFFAKKQKPSPPLKQSFGQVLGRVGVKSGSWPLLLFFWF